MLLGFSCLMVFSIIKSKSDRSQDGVKHKNIIDFLLDEEIN